ncbi:sex determination protein fruitless-like [Cloeon dipterum]|uniref:sex determination protein fruitless-like n=1 Tax=Cloeon dipterum TaxID=197152 RepID=UPI00321FD6FE
MLNSEECGEQQLHLRWNNHSSTMLDVFIEQFKQQNLIDVTLSCQGRHFRAHRMVLSACSPYFQDIFNNHNTPHPIVILNHMNSNHVKSLLEFMYKGEIRVLESELDSFLLLAETLQVKGLCNIRSKIVVKRPTTADLDSEPKSKLCKSEHESNSELPMLGESEANERLESSANEDSAEETCNAAGKKARKVAHIVRVQLGDSSSTDKGDSELASLIKVEPPDITDIDASSPDVKEEDPRVVIDLPVVDDNVTTITTTTFRPNKVAGVTTLKGKKVRGAEVCGGGEDAEKIRRPPNAFMIFANEWRRKLAAENPSDSNKAISIRLGVLWKSMDSNEKQAYYNAAKAADMEHKKKYPGYYYSPKEAREALLRKKLTKKKPCFEATQLVRVLMPVTDDDADDMDDASQVPLS